MSGRPSLAAIEVCLPSLKGSWAAKEGSGLAFEARPDSPFDRGNDELGRRFSKASTAIDRTSEPMAVAFEDAKTFIEGQVDRDSEGRLSDEVRPA